MHWTELCATISQSWDISRKSFRVWVFCVCEKILWKEWNWIKSRCTHKCENVLPHHGKASSSQRKHIKISESFALQSIRHSINKSKREPSGNNFLCTETTKQRGLVFPPTHFRQFSSSTVHSMKSYYLHKQIGYWIGWDVTTFFSCVWWV